MISRTLAVTVAVSAAILAMLCVPSSAAPLPVPASFFDGVTAELANPGGSLPGTNDVNCRLSVRHPNPVVLVHGTGGNRQTNWARMAPVLANEGYCVFALTYGTLPGSWPVSAIGGLTEMEHSAAQLGSFVNWVIAKTGARRVDIVGHSEGTLMPEYWVKYLGGASKVDRYVSIAPYWKGQDSSGCNDAVAAIRSLGLDPKVFWPFPECNQEQYGSPFMTAINSGGTPYAPGVHYTNIMSRTDGIVVPWSDGDVAGPLTTNIVVQEGCPVDTSDHISLVASARTAAFVLNALDPVHQRPVPCLPVAPALPGQ